MGKNRSLDASPTSGSKMRSNQLGTVANISRTAKGQHTPDAIRQRGAIFHFSKANKSVYNRNLYR